MKTTRKPALSGNDTAFRNKLATQRLEKVAAVATELRSAAMANKWGKGESHGGYSYLTTSTKSAQDHPRKVEISIQQAITIARHLRAGRAASNPTMREHALLLITWQMFEKELAGLFGPTVPAAAINAALLLNNAIAAWIKTNNVIVLRPGDAPFDPALAARDREPQAMAGWPEPRKRKPVSILTITRQSTRAFSFRSRPNLSEAAD